MRRNTYSQVASLIQPYMTRPGVAVMVAPGGGSGGSDPSTTGYVAGHAQDPHTGEYYGIKWGITGGSADMSAQLQAMINEVGEWGGGKIILRAENPADSIVLRRLTSIYHSNVHLEFRSPVKLGKIGGIRIMGRMDEFVRPEEDPLASAGKLEVNAEEGDTVLTLKSSPNSMQASDFNDGDYIVIRGRNRADGNAEQKQYVFVTSRDLINNKLNLSAELEETFQPTYGSGDPGEGPLTSSEWPDDATTGSTVYVIRNGQILVNVSTGDYEFEISNVANFTVGDIVRLADTRNEHDMNPSAIRASGLPYENECNMEFFRVIKIVPTTGGNGIVTMDHAVSKNYLAGAPYFGGISKVLPVTNSKISGFDISYDEVQDSKNYHAVTVAFAYNCHVFDGYVNGFGYRLGQGVRITDSYVCSGREILVEGGYRSNSGENYGQTLYKCTGCWFDNCISKDTRHGFLVQAASYFAMRNCQSWGDKISGFDLHGALETHGVIENCLAVRSNQHTDDADNGAGFRVGNTSHTPGSFNIVIKGCTAVGYQEANCAGFDWLPNSANIEFIGCQAYGAYYGIQFSRNSKQVTPVQDSENIRIIDCTFYDCIDRAFRIIGAPNYVYDPETEVGDSNGKILNLTIKGCLTVRCSRHFVIAGNSGVTNLIMEGNDIIDPIALAGQYVYDIKGVLGYTRLRNNSGAGGNKGMILQDCPNAIVVTNVLQPTIEAVAFTDNGGNTALAYVDVFSTGGVGSGIPETIVDVKGDLIVADGADSVIRLAAGTNGQILAANDATASGLEWIAQPAPGIQAIIADAKGDLLVASAADTVVRLPVGADGTILAANSLTATGLEWVVLPGNFTANLRVTSTTPQVQLSETDALTGLQNWSWVLSSGSMRLRRYSDDWTTSSNDIMIIRSLDTLALNEIEIPAGKFGIGIAPTRTLHTLGTIKIQASDELFTTFGWGKALELSENHVIQWLKTTSPISRSMGMLASDGGLYFGRATGNGPTATVTHDWALSAIGVMSVFNRMNISAGSEGSAGVWLRDSSNDNRSFMGLELDGVLTASWGVWVQGNWKLRVNLQGEAAVGGVNNRSIVPGTALAVGGMIQSYQYNDFNNYSSWFTLSGITYLSALGETGGIHYNHIQLRGQSVGLWVAPTTGTAETEAFKASLGSNLAYMPVLIANNNTYRQAAGGSLVIGNSDGNSTHFYYGANEDTYIRSKASSRVYLNDVGHITIGAAGFELAINSSFNSWIALPFTTNWSNYGSGDTSGRYRKIGDIVYLEGLVKRASGNQDMTIAVLPAGYKPTKDFTFDAQMNYSGTYYTARVQVNTAGSITIVYPLSLANGGPIGTSAIGFIPIHAQFSIL